jgi:hypothetical protein
MKIIILATAITGSASAALVNGDFNDGNTDWNVFNAAGIFDYAGNASVPFESHAAATWGSVVGWKLYSGVTQDIEVGTWAEGDTINFGAQAFVDSSLYADNIGYVALQFYDAKGYWSSSVNSANVDNSYMDGNVHDLVGSVTLNSMQASSTRIEFAILFYRPDHENADIDSGTIIWDNAYANVVPTPGALALLGLAGLAGRRRR